MSLHFGGEREIRELKGVSPAFPPMAALNHILKCLHARSSQESKRDAHAPDPQLLVRVTGWSWASAWSLRSSRVTLTFPRERWLRLSSSGVPSLCDSVNQEGNKDQEKWGRRQDSGHFRGPGGLWDAPNKTSQGFFPHHLLHAPRFLFS